MKQAQNGSDTLPRIELLGRFCVLQTERTITRFRTRKTAELLAYLAYYRQRWHSREALIEMLWPDEDVSAMRGRLRVDLNSLRRQLEPPGVPAGAVLRADDAGVQLNPEAYSTDVADFEAVLQAATQAQADTRQAALLTHAVDLYQGELLPGYYADWIQAEREYLAGAYLKALRRLTGCLFRLREYDRALAVALRAVEADPLHEASYRDLMRLYRVLGRPSAALEQYHQLERILQESLGASPSRATQELAAELRTLAGEGVKAGLTSRITPSVPPAHTPAPADIREGEKLARRGSLPLQFSRFFGREEEIEAIQDIFSSTQERLLTLSGPGGTGKTRLAIESARGMQESFAGGTWFVPLADLFDARLIAQAIRDTLQLPRYGNVDPLEQVVDALSAQPALLILDNFEQIAAGGAPVVRTLLKRAEALRCLVTSRRRLNLSGEREFPVPPLPVPRSIDRQEQLLHTASVQLFVDRAQAVRPDFQITASNAQDIARLCVDLEGIPLAIELAAVRAKALSPAQIRERLSERFEILATRRMDKGARHRSLWAAIDWSFHLLAPALQRFFVRLSIFRGGWSLEAAEAVCEEPLALDYLTQLQGHSLVWAEESRLGLRFRMLESLREYAQEQLEVRENVREPLARNGLSGRLHQKHFDYYLNLAEEAEPHLLAGQQKEWLERLETEHDNFRAALSWCQQEPERAEISLQLTGALWRFWYMRGHWSEGRDHLQAALSETVRGCKNPFLARALTGAGNMAWLQSDYAEARALHVESLNLRRELGDKQGVAYSLGSLASVAEDQGDYAGARELQEESLAIQRELGNKRGMAFALNGLGLLAKNQGDYAAGRAFHEESLALRRELGDQQALAHSLNNLGMVALNQGQYETARTYLEECLTIAGDLGDQEILAATLHNLGNVYKNQQDYARAQKLYEQALSINRKTGKRSWQANNLNNLANVAEDQGDYAAARALYEESLAIAKELGYKEGMAHALHNLGSIAKNQEDYAVARPLFEESLALRRELGDMYGIAFSLEALAALAIGEGQTERAVRLMAAAHVLREAIDSPLPPNKRQGYDQQVVLARTALGEESFSAFWEQGKEMNIEQAIKYALQDEPQESKERPAE